MADNKIVAKRTISICVILITIAIVTHFISAINIAPNNARAGKCIAERITTMKCLGYYGLCVNIP